MPADLQESAQKLAQYIHTVTGMHVGIHDIERFFSVSAGDDCRNLCQYCRQNSASFMSKCYCSDKEHLKQVYREQKISIYQCHMGMTEVIIPIYDTEKFSGVIFMGQVQIVPDENLSFENLYNRLAAEYPDCVYDGAKSALETAYHNTASMTRDQLEGFIGLVQYAEKGCHVNQWLSYTGITTHTIVEQYLTYLDLEHIPLTEISIADIAKRLNLSYSQLNRVAASLYGMPLKQYILRVKVKAAAALLCERSELTVADVSSRVGIFNTNYFIKLFQKHMGCRCSEYREQMKTTVNPCRRRK